MLQATIEALANSRIVRPITSRLLRLFSIDIPPSVRINGNLSLPHGGMGVVIHPKTIIGHNVKIYQQVTIGRGDIWTTAPGDDFKGFKIGNDVIICAGAKIITSTELEIGEGTVIGANSVLTKSTGKNEIWAGIPAKLVRKK